MLIFFLWLLEQRQPIFPGKRIDCFPLRKADQDPSPATVVVPLLNLLADLVQDFPVESSQLETPLSSLQDSRTPSFDLRTLSQTLLSQFRLSRKLVSILPPIWLILSVFSHLPLIRPHLVDWISWLQKLLLVLFLSVSSLLGKSAFAILDCGFTPFLLSLAQTFLIQKMSKIQNKTRNLD